MRLAVVSDIHANLPAWRAVIADAVARGADAVICLGDIVGYGPWPADVLAEVRTRCRLCVLGNHDAAMVGRFSLERFRRGARRAARWTRRQLNADALEFLRGLPLSAEVDDLLFVHAETAAPEEFGYVDDEEDAAVCFRATEARLVFIGHTHVPSLFAMRDGRVERLSADDRTLEPSVRYLIGVGSVGDPRDGVSAASYVFFDDATESLEFRRCEFDLATCKAAWAAVRDLEPPYFLRAHRDTAAEREAAIRAPKVAQLRVKGVLAPTVHLHATDLAAADTAATPLSLAGQGRVRRVWPRTVAGRVALALIALGAFAVGLALRGSRPRAPAESAATAPVGGAPSRVPDGAAPPAPRVPPPPRAPGEIVLAAAAADRYGQTFRMENFGGGPHIGHWHNERDYLVWRFRTPSPAEYEIGLDYALGGPVASSRVLIAVGRQSLRFALPSTGNWSNFTERVVGHLRLPAGLTVLEVRPDGRPSSGIMNLRSVRLRERPSGATAEPDDREDVR